MVKAIFAVIVLTLILPTQSLAQESACAAIKKAYAADTESKYKAKIPASGYWYQAIVSSKNSKHCGLRGSGSCVITDNVDQAKTDLTVGTNFDGIAKKVNDPKVTGCPAATYQTIRGRTVCLDPCTSTDAMGKSNYKIGDVLYIPELEGKNCAGRVHEGCIIITDETHKMSSSKKGLNIFLGRCKKIQNGVCDDHDLADIGRAIGRLKGKEAFVASKELAAAFELERKNENLATMNRIFPDKKDAAKEPTVTK